MTKRALACAVLAAGLVGLVAIGGPSRAASTSVTYYSGQIVVEAGGVAALATNTSTTPKTFAVRFFQQNGTEYSDSMDEPVTVNPGATYGYNFFCTPDVSAPCLVRFSIKANSSAVIPSAAYDPPGVDEDAEMHPGDFIKK